MENNDNLEDWARHFDLLLWTVSTLFVTALVFLINLSIGLKDFFVTFIGYLLSIIPIYFATSFRELKFLMINKLDGKIKKIFEEKRKFPQWFIFNLVFFIISLIWLKLLYSQSRNHEDQYFVIIVGILGFLSQVYLFNEGKHFNSEKEDKKN